MKGVSVAVAMVIVLMTLMVVVVPALIILNEVPVYSTQGQFQGSAMSQLQSQQNNQVFRGNPNIYYDSSTNPSLQFYFNSLPAQFNISQVYYFNGTVWVPVLKSYVAVSGNARLPLPPQAFNKPVIVLTALGNIYFLNPNTSIATVSVTGPSGIVPLYIVAFVVNGSDVIPVSIQVVFGSNPPALTPVLYYVLPGTYTVSNKNGSMIFLPKYSLTATFQGWSIIGKGTIKSQSPQSVTFTVYGPTVLAAVYKAQLQKFQVTIVPQGIPLGTKVNMKAGYLTSLNSTVPVMIDNRTYYVGASGITLNLTFGYHIVLFPSQYNITFDYKITGNTVPAGQITTYNFTGLTTSTTAIKVASNKLIFVNGTGTVYGNYQAAKTYYLVVVKNYFYLPQGDTLVYNTSPVLGNIAGQLLEVNNTYTWGPEKDYVPQKFYVPAGSIYRVTYDYISVTSYGTYTIKYGGSQYSYYSLLSSPRNVTIYYANGTVVTINIGSYGYPSGNPYFTVNMPITIVNYHKWVFGGVYYL